MGNDEKKPARVELAYPLEYIFKIMGLAGDDFPEHARRLVANVVGEVPVERVTVKASSQGKFHSVSVSIVLSSEEERQAIYRALHEDARIVYYL